RPSERLNRLGNALGVDRIGGVWRVLRCPVLQKEGPLVIRESAFQSVPAVYGYACFGAEHQRVKDITGVKIVHPGEVGPLTIGPRPIGSLMANGPAETGLSRGSHVRTRGVTNQACE